MRCGRNPQNRRYPIDRINRPIAHEKKKEDMREKNHESAKKKNSLIRRTMISKLHTSAKVFSNEISLQESADTCVDGETEDIRSII
jgi:hypothetical protein